MPFAASPEARGLLRVLLVWLGALPADATAAQFVSDRSLLYMTFMTLSYQPETRGATRCLET